MLRIAEQMENHRPALDLRRLTGGLSLCKRHLRVRGCPAPPCKPSLPGVAEPGGQPGGVEGQQNAGQQVYNVAEPQKDGGEQDAHPLNPMDKKATRTRQIATT